MSLSLIDIEDPSNPFCYLSNGQRKQMRLFVTYDGERTSMDFPFGSSVASVKQLIAKRFNIRQNSSLLGNETQVKTILVVNYSGAELQDDWILSDLSISPGTTLKAYMKAEMDPIFYFKIMYNQEIVPVMDKIKLLELTTSKLRSLASSKSGLPCSVFRMVGPLEQDMFDCQQDVADHYNIKPGSVIRIETWDGWNEFLRLCTQGFTSSVMENINMDDELLARFQMKVAMFIAAHFGHVDLAVSLCKHGIRPDEPVGQHPLRQWCSNTQHIDCLKAPIHEAVECGQLIVLRSFVHHNITSIFAKDGYGLQPLNIALRRKMRSCASFLLSKQWTRKQYNKNTIPLAIFHRLKMWCDKARDRVCLVNSVDKTPSKRKIVRSFPLVGQGVFIDGYSTDQISSRSSFPQKSHRKDQETRLESRYEHLYGTHPEQYYRNLDMSMSRTNKNRKSNFSGNVSLNASNRFASMSDLVSLESDSQADFSSPDIKENSKDRGLKLPKIPMNSNMKTANARTPSSSTQSNRMEKKTTKRTRTNKKHSNKEHGKSEPNLMANKNMAEYGIPLPLISIDDTPRPYCYMGSDKSNEIVKTLEEYYNKRGYHPRDYAIKCLCLTSKLKEKPWLAQVQIAMSLSKESVKKCEG